MKAAEKLNGLVVYMRSAVQKIGYIVIRVIRAHWTGGQAGETGLAKIRIEPGRFADSNGINGADVKTRHTI
jgi:hypothetical protein